MQVQNLDADQPPCEENKQMPNPNLPNSNNVDVFDIDE